MSEVKTERGPDGRFTGGPRVKSKTHALGIQTSNFKRKLQRATRDLREIALDSKMGQGNYSQVIAEINQLHDKLMLQINIDYKRGKIIAKALDKGPKDFGSS